MGRFGVNLYRRGDFVPQYTPDWCVGASIQMMLNLTRDRNEGSRRVQQQYWEMARDRSFSPFGGAHMRGWASTVNELEIGPYELVSVPEFDEALRVAASAIRATGRPVGLGMHRGRHAWVMSGFESIGDPRVHRNFRVTGVRVLDPFYPHGNRRWGRSPPPCALVPPSFLDDQFVERTSGRVDLDVPPGYLLVLPRTAATN